MYIPFSNNSSILFIILSQSELNDLILSLIFSLNLESILKLCKLLASVLLFGITKEIINAKEYYINVYQDFFRKKLSPLSKPLIKLFSCSSRM